MVWPARVCAGSGDDSDDDGDDEDDDDDDDDNDDGAGDLSMTIVVMVMVMVMTMVMAVVMVMTVLVMTMMHCCHATPSSLYTCVIDGRSAHPLIGKATLTPNPEVVLLSPRSHTWLEANGFKYSSSPRLIPPRSQPMVPQGRIWLEA